MKREVNYGTGDTVKLTYAAIGTAGYTADDRFHVLRRFGRGTSAQYEIRSLAQRCTPEGKPIYSILVSASDIEAAR